MSRGTKHLQAGHGARGTHLAQGADDIDVAAAKHAQGAREKLLAQQDRRQDLARGHRDGGRSLGPVRRWLVVAGCLFPGLAGKRVVGHPLGVLQIIHAALAQCAAQVQHRARGFRIDPAQHDSRGSCPGPNHDLGLQIGGGPHHPGLVQDGFAHLAPVEERLIVRGGDHDIGLGSADLGFEIHLETRHHGQGQDGRGRAQEHAENRDGREHGERGKQHTHEGEHRARNHTDRTSHPQAFEDHRRRQGQQARSSARRPAEQLERGQVEDGEQQDGEADIQSAARAALRIAQVAPGHEPLETGASLFTHSGLMSGNRMTSRMEGWSVSSMTRRSTPMPSPAVGGRPYSSARQ